MAYPILVPPLGQTTDTVVLATWYKQVGQDVTAGEPLFAIETDKATLDIEAQDAGVLAQVGAQAGEEVKVLSSIGLIAAPGEVLEANPAPVKPTGTEAKQPERQPVEPVKPVQTKPQVTEAPRSEEAPHATIPAALTPVKRTEGERVFISPRARRLALAQNVRWENIAGTGPEGAIVERDVQYYLAQANEASEVVPVPQAATPYPINPAQASQTLVAQADVSALITLCGRYAKRDVSVSLEGILMFILAQVLRTLP